VVAPPSDADGQLTERRALRVELAIVLSVTFGLSAVTALLQLADLAPGDMTVNLAKLAAIGAGLGFLTTLSGYPAVAVPLAQDFANASGIPLKASYDEADGAAARAAFESGAPGTFPFVRGIRGDGYRSRLWTMRQYAGFATAADPDNPEDFASVVRGLAADPRKRKLMEEAARAAAPGYDRAKELHKFAQIVERVAAGAKIPGSGSV